MKVSGWGRYPVVDATITYPVTQEEVVSQLQNDVGSTMIPFGLGRSYGDSALSEKILSTVYLDHILGFHESEGIIHCESGVSLADIVDIYLPKGWFLPVTPGSKYITVGGAIASDVHGKNHHKKGCFSNHVVNIKVATKNGEIVECSPKQNVELFQATCGGMGLTGVILEAKFKLLPVPSAFINQTTIKAKCLDETLELFEQHRGASYSVAWLDCLARGKALGRSHVILGEHAQDGGFIFPKKQKWTVPCVAPSFLLNRFSLKVFNELYYRRITQHQHTQVVNIESFFYPLDSIQNWNRLYGKNGFVQYQFVVPIECGREALTKIITKISDFGEGSVLCVLKALGKKNSNYLSFPIEGYTLALDFKTSRSTLELLDDLDKLVIQYGGRIYLTKDSRLRSQNMQKMYPDLTEFLNTRQRYCDTNSVSSYQSLRLGL